MSIRIAKNKAKSIYENLKAGADWNEQCMLYSDDVRTKKKGGQLQWFGTGNLVPAFESAAFALRKPGDISTPIQTRFGWHIIQLIDKKGVPPLDEVRADLESKISRDTRAADKKSTTISKLKGSQNFKAFSSVRQQLVNYFDSTLLEANWTFADTNADLKQILFTTNNVSYTVNDFFNFVQEKQKKRRLTSLTVYVDQLYNQFEEKRHF